MKTEYKIVGSVKIERNEVLIESGAILPITTPVQKTSYPPNRTERGKVNATASISCMGGSFHHILDAKEDYINRTDISLPITVSPKGIRSAFSPPARTGLFY